MYSADQNKTDMVEPLRPMNICAQVHPDPVLLLTKERWLDLIPRRIYKKPYVLVYMIEQDQNLFKKAKEYAQLHNCDVISNKHSFRFILHNSPAEFLSWVYYAECVFTNSFHGSA